MISTVSRESAPRSTNLDSAETASSSVPSCSAMISRTSARTWALSYMCSRRSGALREREGGSQAGRRWRSSGKSVTRKLRPVYLWDRGALRFGTKITYNSHDNQTLGAHGLGDAGLRCEQNDGSEWII